MGQPSRLRECEARDKDGSGTKCRETPEEIRGKGEGRGGERPPRSSKDRAAGGLGWKPNSAHRGGGSLEPLHPATAGMLRTRLLGQLGCSRWRSGLARSPPPRPPHSCPRRAGGGAAQLTWPFGAGPPVTRGSGGGGGILIRTDFDASCKGVCVRPRERSGAAVAGAVCLRAGRDKMTAV